MLLIASAVTGLVLVAGLGMYQIGRVYEAANFGNDNTVPALTALGKVQFGLSQVRIRTVRHIFFGTDAAKMAEIDRTIEQAWQELNAAVKEYEPTIADNEDRRRFDGMSALLKEFAAAQVPLLEASRANKKDQARELLAAADPVGHKLNDAIGEYMTFNTDLGKKAAIEAKAIEHTAVTLSIVISVLAIVAALAIGLVIQLPPSCLDQC
jgi:hypothetical protein